MVLRERERLEMSTKVINAIGRTLSHVSANGRSSFAVQTEVLRSQLTTTGTAYGIAYKQGFYFIIDHCDTCFRIPNSEFLLDYDKLKRCRMLRIDMYEETLAAARKLEKIHRHKKINGVSYAVFALDGMPLFAPDAHLDLFDWKNDTFYAANEFSPIFVVPPKKDNTKKPATLLGVKGFFSQVQVSGFKLKTEREADAL